MRYQRDTRIASDPGKSLVDGLLSSFNPAHPFTPLLKSLAVYQLDSARAHVQNFFVFSSYQFQLYTRPGISEWHEGFQHGTALTRKGIRNASW